jgi:hypothetical protein
MKHPLTNIQHRVWGLLLSTVALLTSTGALSASTPHFVSGDPIGPDNGTTDQIGGFTAVQQDGVNMGQPAILVSLTGQELLTEFRAIAFGIPNADGDLRFDEFNYVLDVWTSSDYFAGSQASHRIDLGGPKETRLVEQAPNWVAPESPFGTAGDGGANALTYDFRFNIYQFSPLPAGEYVFGFQSYHDTRESGSLRIAGAAAEEGPLPLFSRDNVFPRGVLGGQDPEEISLYWGMSLAATLAEPTSDKSGDFNRDTIVDAADYVLWRRYSSLPIYIGEELLNHAGDGLNGVDIGDYAVWQGRFGTGTMTGSNSATGANVPEPSALSIMLLTVGVTVFRRRVRLEH